MIVINCCIRYQRRQIKLQTKYKSNNKQHIITQYSNNKVSNAIKEKFLLNRLDISYLAYDRCNWLNMLGKVQTVDNDDMLIWYRKIKKYSYELILSIYTHDNIYGFDKLDFFWSPKYYEIIARYEYCTEKHIITKHYVIKLK